MRNDEHFWWTTLLRGLIAILAGSSIMMIPGMARTVLLLPIAVAFSILGLAFYGTLDSVIVFVTSYMTASRKATWALRIQGAAGIIVGVLLYWIFFDHVHLHWFLLLIAAQALATSVGEFLVALHSKTHATSRWNFAVAAVAFSFGCTYLYIALTRGDRMAPEDISWLIYGYLLTFGFAQCITAARMIYEDHHVPVHQEA